MAELTSNPLRPLFKQTGTSTSFKDSENLIKNAGSFHSEASSGGAFQGWIAIYLDILNDKMLNLPDETGKCGSNERSQYPPYVLTKDPTDYCHIGNIEKFKDYCGGNTSLFNTRFQCLGMTIREMRYFCDSLLAP